MATGFRDGILPRESILTVTVRKSDFPDGLFSFDMIERSGRPHLEIRCRDFTSHDMSVGMQDEARNKLKELLVAILARVFVLRNPEETLTKLMHDEKGLERAINFTGSFIVQGNVLGDSPKTKLSTWKKGNERHYPVRRSEPWEASEENILQGDDKEPQSLEMKAGQGEPPVGVFTEQTIRHTEMESVSLIRESFWEHADWSGVAYFTTPDDSPVLALVFKDSEAGRQIFKQWRLELGDSDDNDRLRVSIIRGIDRNMPFKYRMVIGANIPTARSGSRILYITSRMQTMEPLSYENLGRFLDAIQKFEHYVLVPALEGDNGRPPKPIFDDMIGKRHLHVKEAWEVGQHDLDSVGVWAEDDPVMPASQVDPPVQELLKWKRTLD